MKVDTRMAPARSSQRHQATPRVKRSGARVTRSKRLLVLNQHLLLNQLPANRYEALVVSAAMDPRQRRLFGDMLHEIANTLQEVIGVCAQLRAEDRVTPALIARLDSSLYRGVAALKRLQPPIQHTHR